ncbi:MAG: phosphopantetheine-binding protein [Acidobacteriota bacterium]
MDTLTQLRNLTAKQFGLDPQAIDMDGPIEALGADSLDYLEFLFDLETEFGVSIDQDAAQQTKTLRALSGLIDDLIPTPSPTQ